MRWYGLLIVLLLGLGGGRLSFAAVEPLAAVIGDVPHPRLILSRESLAAIKADARIKASSDYRELIGYARWRVQSTGIKELAHHHFQPEVIVPLALAALLSDDDHLVRYAAEGLVELAGLHEGTGNDTDQRQRLLSLALGFDWLYDHLSGGQRQKVAGSISRHIRLLRRFADAPKYTGGHDRFGSIALLAGSLAIIEEGKGQQIAELLDRLRRQWAEGFNPFQAFAAQGGGYVMGWQYGAGYTSLWPYLIGERLGLDWLRVDWLKELPLWYIYGLRGDNTFPRLGDCDDVRVGQHLAMLMAYASSRWADGWAEWFYQTRLNSLWGPYRVWRIIFPGRVIQLSPDTPGNELPPARHFSGSGVVVARDSWHETATHLVFKSSPFYSLNHQHKDQNHIELSYKGSLLIDSGCYDRYGSRHWQNYYTRSIAHNTLVVSGAGKKYVLDGRTLSNDGGQMFRSASLAPRGEEPADLTQALSDKYRLDGVTGFAGSAQGVWMQGDATKAYDGSIVASYLRDVVMVYRPAGRRRPLLVIRDRVSLIGKHTPRILFHSNGKPTLTERTFTIANSGGGLVHGKVFAEAALTAKVVGGPGKEWLVDGVSYPPDKGCGGAGGADPGAWRIEVGPANGVDSLAMITVLAIDDATAPEGSPKSSMIAGDGYHGVVVGSDCIVFPTDGAKREWSFAGDRFDGVERVLLAGGVKGATVLVNGRVVTWELLGHE